jgi:hypothetical protein
MAERIDREELRKLIREALREALSTEAAAPPPPLSSGVPEFSTQRSRSGEHPTSVRGRVREGGQAGGRNPSPSPGPSPQGGGERRIDSGVLTEAAVLAAGKTHAKIVITPEVAVTPLARDRAREMKIEIVRQKP